ncbi:MAG: UDP-N-acetylmuramoyl-L-alanyl-D-glutamate--2,6-diaminopimelate ligase [Chthoniobacterales bacterium]
MTTNLKNLLASADVHPPRGADEISISSLCYDSRRALPGSLFFALGGLASDGNRFVTDAVTRGAVAVVSEQAIDDASVPVARVPSARDAMADVAATFYEKPSDGLRCVAVTGTNGKTTTVFLVKHICESVMMRCGLIGTVRYEVGGEVLPAPHTTPESVDLQHLLAQMRDAGDRAVAMEASSHAIVQKRVRGVQWDAAVFTNLTQDHLDYHKTMDAYFEAKASLFDTMFKQTTKRGKAVVNIDDRYGGFLRERIPKQIKPITYGQAVRADFRASDIRFNLSGTQFQLEAKGRQYLVRSPLIGMFNVYNVVGAIAAASAIGIEIRKAIHAVADAPQVPGRLERVSGKRSFQVFVDYAHTDDALTNVLKTLRDLGPRRIITVFGCGGDRDRAKRPLMARAVEAYSDHAIITSDNPRNEDPEAIVRDIQSAMRGNAHETILDRADAIQRAIQVAGASDIVLIAGKGHEDYQEVAGKRAPFDDTKVARRAIDAKPTQSAE